MAEIVRFLFAIMLSMANMIIYGLKVNISTAIIGMVKSHRNDSSGIASTECPEFEHNNGSASTDLDGPYEWSATQQGLVVSLYFAGYLVGMFPAGYFADRFNTKWVLLISIFFSSIFTFLVPFVANEIFGLYALRFFTGLVSAANLPVINVLVGKWVVYEEKSTWVGIIYAGTSIGTVLSILTAGLIMKYLNWQWIFYIHGCLPLLWCAIFAIFFADNPENQILISENERNLLTKSYGHRGPSLPSLRIPWREIFTSPPFWALLVTNTLGNFCWYFLLTQLPLYMNKILRFDIGSNAVISCIPYLINSFTNPILGRILDFGRQRGFWTQTTARKTVVAISCIAPSILMIIITYIGCNRVATTILLILSIVIAGAIFVGHLTNHNDIAPNYAGILMGITNTPGTISALILPALVGALTEKGHTFARWRIIFWVNVIAQTMAFLVFTIFGSAKIQKWNYPEGKMVIPGSSLSKPQENRRETGMSENSKASPNMSNRTPTNRTPTKNV